MLKQSASRNQRYKGFKVKHVLQICALLALCIWVLNQVKNTYDKNGNGIFRGAAMKLRRKDLDPQVKGSSESGEAVAEEEVEEIKPEESEDDGRGGGDDEIDGRDREKAEEEETLDVEDLIDEEDKEKENQIEDLSLLEEQTINEGEENFEDKTHDDASTTVLQDDVDATGIAQIRRLRSAEKKVKDDEQKGKQKSSSFRAALSTNDIDLNVDYNTELG